MSSFNNTYTSRSTVSAPVVERVLLPTQIVEKPVAIHEEIRKELIEEIQPVVNVEKLKTEVHQVTQPLFDKEVRAVQIENRTLASEVLPEVRVEGRGFRAADDFSTTKFLDTKTVVVEKPAMYNEVERRQIIEEIQPVIYKETVVPTVIQETKPMYQKVVEGPVYSSSVLPAREVAVRSQIAETYVTDNTVVAPLLERVMLPTQIVEKPTAVHEEIRRETIEEVQPVWNVEKIKTEVHQITAPLYDKEIRPVIIERKVLGTEILPEVLVEGRGVRAVEDISTTQYLQTKSTLIEKPAIYNEVERTQIIEEIQPVLYKETVVPTVIRETKPVFQKIVEGPVYTQQTLAPRSLHETNFRYPVSQATVVETIVPPVVERTILPQVVERTVLVDSLPRDEVIIIKQEQAPVVAIPHGRKEIVEEVTSTTTTTTTAPIVGASNASSGQKHHLFHRHQNTTPATSTTGSNWSQTTTTTPALNTTGYNRGISGVPETQHFHKERTGPNGQKIVEDTTTTHQHSEQVFPARLH